MENIRFGFGQSSLGTVLVASSAKGVAAIFMGDDRDILRRDLANAFPDAQLAPDDDGLADTVAKVVAFIDAPQHGLELALDMRGSAFEQSVWRRLQEVPAGKTVTYGEIARSLPPPATAQDVGPACAGNVLAVAVPCHRVVKADGSISGYRWGVRRKRKLINLEGIA